MITSPLTTPFDPSSRSTWPHRAWLACGCTIVLISLAKAIMGAAESHIWPGPTLAGLVGYILADLVSGVYHWVIDNYGSASTPIFGAQIDAFHREQPWAITWRQLAKNLHTLARAVAFTMLLKDLAVNDPIFQAFVTVWSGCLLFSQQFHVWAHMTKSRLPPLVIGLQDMGLLVSHSPHANRHRPPYNNNYCIVSAVWNEFLDRWQIFKALEMILFCKLGVRPRSKSEPSSIWTEEIETQGRLNP